MENCWPLQPISSERPGYAFDPVFSAWRSPDGNDRDLKLANVAVGIQGFGNVGSNAARLIDQHVDQHGGRIVAVSDISGGIANDKGIDIAALLLWVEQNKVVKGFEGAEFIEGDAVLTYKADVLIPAALENAITADNADQIKAEVVVEAANGPVTPQAHAVMQKRVARAVAARREIGHLLPMSLRD